MRHGTYATVCAFNPGFTTAYDDMPTVRASIVRGKGVDLGGVQMGTCRLVVADEARVYDPSNASSPLVSAGYLRPLRKLIVYVTPTGAGAPTPIYTGYLTRAWHDRRVGVRQSILEFLDGFWFLDHTFPVVASSGVVTTGQALALMLTALGVPGGEQDIDQGYYVPDFAAYGDATALAIAAELALVDEGLFFYSAAGKHTYRDRSARYGRGRASTVATISSANVAYQVPALDVANIVNAQSCQVQRRQSTANPDGTVSVSVADLGDLQTVTDTAYLGTLQAGAPIASVFFRDTTQANSLAQQIVARKKTGDVPMQGVTLHGLTLASIQTQVLLELGNAVALSGLGVASEGLIESIGHEITRDAHTTTLAISSRPGYAFTVGTSTIGGADLIGY